MPTCFINQSEGAKVDFARMYLWPTGVEMVDCRDTKEYVVKQSTDS